MGTGADRNWPASPPPGRSRKATISSQAEGGRAARASANLMLGQMPPRESVPPGPAFPCPGLGRPGRPQTSFDGRQPPRLAEERSSIPSGVAGIGLSS